MLGVETGASTLDDGAKTGQLLEVGGRRCRSNRCPFAVRNEANDPAVVRVRDRRTSSPCTARSTSSTALWGRSNRWSAVSPIVGGSSPSVTANRQEQLMLLSRHAGGDGLFLAPVQELPQSGAEVEQLLVLSIL